MIILMPSHKILRFFFSSLLLLLPLYVLKYWWLLIPTMLTTMLKMMMIMMMMTTRTIKHPNSNSKYRCIPIPFHWHIYIVKSIYLNLSHFFVVAVLFIAFCNYQACKLGKQIYIYSIQPILIFMIETYKLIRMFLTIISKMN